MVNKILAFAACIVLTPGCTSVMSADAERSPSFAPTGRTQSLPGGPRNDFAYSIAAGRGAAPSNMSLLEPGTLPFAGRQIVAPETMRLDVFGRREGASTNITDSQVFRNDKQPQQHSFRSRNFAVTSDFAMRASAEVRYLAQSGGPIARSLSATTAAIGEYVAPAKLAWRAGPAGRAFEHIFDDGLELAAAEFEADGSRCIKVRLYALGESNNALEFSAPMLGALTIQFASLLDFVSVSATGQSIVALDPAGPEDSWRSECAAADTAPGEAQTLSRRFNRDAGPVNDFVFGGAARGWSAIALNPGDSSATAIYFPDREGRELTAADFEFVRPLRALLVRQAAIRAGGE